MFKYLQEEMTEPLAFMHAHFQTIRQNGKNCLARETRFPRKQAMCVGSLVMLTHNFHVSAGLMNGAIGTVRDIHYENPEAMGRKDAKFYVIVEFPKCTLTTSLVPGRPATWVPIPVMVARCDRQKCGCCTCTYVPLRVCIVLSIYKSQGQTIGGEDSLIDRVVAHLPTKDIKAAAGSALVAMSRVMDPDLLAFGNAEGAISTAEVREIGTTPAYANRRTWLRELRRMASITQQRTRDLIAGLTEDGTFDSGCKFLFRWYIIDVMPPPSPDDWWFPIARQMAR